MRDVVFVDIVGWNYTNSLLSVVGSEISLIVGRGSALLGDGSGVIGRMCCQRVIN